MPQIPDISYPNDLALAFIFIEDIMSEIATENADRRISELLLLNETLRQQNHNVQEEIFDLKMCMATTEVESTSAIKKELDALKSQMAFKVCACLTSMHIIIPFLCNERLYLLGMCALMCVTGARDAGASERRSTDQAHPA